MTATRPGPGPSPRRTLTRTASRYIVTSKETLDAAIGLLLRQEAFAFDIEAQGEHRGVPHLCDVTWISLASDHVTCAIPMGHPAGSRQAGTRTEPKLCADGKIRQYRKPVWEPPPPQLDRSYVFDRLRPLFLNDRQVKVCADQTVDSVAIAKYLGEVPWPPYDCVITMDWLLDENRLQHGVKPQAWDYFRCRYDRHGTGRAIECFPFAAAGHYSAMDAMYEWFLYKRHRALLAADPDLARAWQLERDLMPVLIGMRLAGADVDEDLARRHQQALQQRLEHAKAAVYKAAGRQFSINSARQRQDILYLPRSQGGQGLKPWKLTAGAAASAKTCGAHAGTAGWSTDDSVLQSYPDNEVCAALREYGDVQKLLSTYIGSWLGAGGKPPMIHDGKIHTWFKQYGTVTGRLSSASPNLQNCPRPDTADGRLLRSVFRAPDGHLLVVADYGQIELVIIAHYIGRGGLYQALTAGEDPHRTTAARMFGCPPGQVTPRQRQLAKTANFLISYGGGWETLMVSANKHLPAGEKITAAAARDTMRLYADTYPEVDAFKDAVFRAARARKPPHVRTLLGRKRRMPRLNAADPKTRAAAERQLFSGLIQGSAADLLKLALIRADAMLAERLPGAWLVLSVHDEIVAAAPEDQASRARDIIIEAMTGPEMQALIRVPLKVDAKIARNWADAKT
jgi:DNA polymerase I-like protein with 3'-5' exonuclease and polymerase domains